MVGLDGVLVASIHFDPLGAPMMLPLAPPPGFLSRPFKIRSCIAQVSYDVKSEPSLHRSRVGWTLMLLSPVEDRRQRKIINCIQENCREPETPWEVEYRGERDRCTLTQTRHDDMIVLFQGSDRGSAYGGDENCLFKRLPIHAHAGDSQGYDDKIHREILVRASRGILSTQASRFQEAF